MVAFWVAMVVAGSAENALLDGGLNNAEVAEIIGWNGATLGPCFAASRKTPSVRYTFEITPAGTVTRLRFESSKNVEPKDVTCVGTALERWEFPSRAQGTEVSWNLVRSTADAGVDSEPVIVDPVELARFDADLFACSDSDAKLTGRVTLEQVVSATGLVLEQHLSPASRCLSVRARGWRWPPTEERRRLVLRWIVASDEKAARRFFIPSEPAREIIGTHVGNEGLPKAHIAEVVSALNPRIRDCYERGLQRDHSMAGKLSVTWTIGPQGLVTEAHVAKSDPKVSESVANCCVEVVRGAVFAPPVGGGNVTVTFPWIFKPQEQTPLTDDE